MKKIVVLLAICGVSVFLADCSKKMAPTKSLSPAEEVAEMNQKYNAAQIAQGKIVFEQNCGKCHELHQPAEFTIPKWDKILPKMCKKSELSAEQAGIVRAWVITNAKAS